MLNTKVAMQLQNSCLLLLLLPLLLVAEAAPADREMEVLMPAVSPKKEDTYLCAAVKVDDTRFLKKFTPLHKSGHAHHIILAGCEKPGSDKKVWNCGEMLAADGPVDGVHDVAPQCAEGSRTLYAYAMDAPALTLPAGVTFGVGARFNLPYLVVQVHYKNADAFVKDPSLKDSSGVRLEYQLQPSPRLAGIHLSLTDGVVPAHSVSTMETACSYNGDTELHPFAFRTHTHSHGRVVSGFRVRNGDWTLIGSANPQMPQMFYPVNNSATVRPGDTVAARCVMENKGDADVAIGATQKDEMCNFYMMYWINSADVGKDGNQECFSAFDNNGARLWESAPDAAALLSATIPGTDHVMRQMYREMNEDMDDLMRELGANEAAMGDRIDDDEGLFDF